MHGDITRSTFDPAKAYTAVRQQQGRVQLDADWNEQVDIALHDTRAARVDVIGPAGAPLVDPGFEVVAVPPDPNVAADTGGLTVGPGRYYLDGLRLEATEPVELTGLPTAVGAQVVVHLDGWERGITAVEDPHLREVALGGPDTTVRTRAVWSLRALPVTAVADPGCGTPFAEWDVAAAPSTGTLQVQLDPAGAGTGPCLVPETAGYRGLQNRTFRVQVHTPTVDVATGAATGQSPTVLWSADDASTLAAWVAAPSRLDVQVDRLGPGGTDGFGRGDLVELTTDATDLAGTPGLLASVADVLDDTTLRLTPLGAPDAAAAAVLEQALADLYDPGLHPKVRRWDGGAPLDLGDGEWAELVDGLEVRLDGGVLRTGDHWLVPARTAVLPGTGDWQLDWPQPVAGQPVPVLPQGPVHHRARLAVAVLEAGGWQVLADCRELFGPLTDDLQFTGRGGDGQQAPSGGWLPVPLTVGTTRGRVPAPDQPVTLTVTEGGGTLATVAPLPDGQLPVGATSGGSVQVRTDPAGLARVWWRLGPATPVPAVGDTYDPSSGQRVTAVLGSSTGVPRHQPVDFVARAVDALVLVAAGGDGQLGRPGETLELALRARVSAGSTPATGQRVAFEIESRMFDGAALDELTGGSLIASVNRDDQATWPGGSRFVRVVVRTDDAGVARAQWVLGTELGLTVQRVTATLLDQPSAAAQTVLFGAHLALASEVAWAPCPQVGAVTDATVQGALDLFCAVVGGPGTSAVAAIRRPRPRLVPLRPENTLALAFWDGAIVVTGAFTLDADPPDEALQACLVVSVDIPDTEWGAGALRSLVVAGTVRIDRSSRNTVLIWTIGDLRARSADLIGAGARRLRLVLLPSLLSPNAPAMPFHAAVTIA